MLTKRTNVLFDEELWGLLTTVADRQQTSVGELVRSAVRKVYSDQTTLQKRADIHARIMKIRPKPVKGTIDYKELINYGRER